VTGGDFAAIFCPRLESPSLLCYVAAAVGTSKLNMIVQLYALRDKSRVLGK